MKIIEALGTLLGTIIFIPIVWCLEIIRYFYTKKEKALAYQEAEARHQQLHALAAEYYISYNRELAAIDVNIRALVETNTAENNALALVLLQSQLEWKKQKALSFIVLTHLRQASDSSRNHSTRIEIPIGDALLCIRLVAIDEGDLFEIIYTVSLTVELKQENEVIEIVDLELMPTYPVGHDVSLETLQGFFLENFEAICAKLEELL